VAVLCRKLGVSRSGYYAWRNRDVSERRLQDLQLLPVMTEIFTRSRETYGYPRIHAALKTAGIHCGRHRIARIMRENGLKARMARRFKYHRHRDYLFAETPNLLLRLGPVTVPNHVWVGDVSYIRVRGRWSYIAIVMDHYTRRIIGWSFSTTHNAALTREALLMAVQTSPHHPHHLPFGSGLGVRQQRIPSGTRCRGPSRQHEPQRALLGQRPHGILLRQLEDRDGVLPKL